jgi:hypothetical protein
MAMETRFEGLEVENGSKVSNRTLTPTQLIYRSMGWMLELSECSRKVWNNGRPKYVREWQKGKKEKKNN